MKKLFTLCFLLFTSPVWAATYYVATTGNDANSCATSATIGTPKRTIASGLTCLTVAGDILYIRGGNYPERGLSLAGVANGTSDSVRTTISNYQSEAVWLNPSGTIGSSPTISLGNKSYLLFNGINYDGANLLSTSTGCPLYIDLQSTTNSHNRFSNFEAKNVNCSAAILGGGTFDEFINLTIHDVGPQCLASGPCTQPDAFYIFGDHFIFDGLTVYNIPFGGVMMNDSSGSRPHANDNNIVRNSTFYNTGYTVQPKSGVSTAILVGTGDHIQIYNNRIYGWGQDIHLWHPCDDVQIWNNLIYNWNMLPPNAGNGEGIVNEGCTNAKIWNNTLYNSANIGQAIWNQSSWSGMVTKNNIMWNGGNGVALLNEASGLVTSNNLCSQAQTGCTVSNPNFLNAANGDFHLTSSSTGAIGQGADLSASFTTDFAGTTRTVPWDIGAYKYSSGTVTMTITPTSPISSPAISTTTSFTFAGTTTGTVTSVGITLNGVSQGNATGTATWTKAVTLVPGNNTLVATATDGTTNVTTTNIVKMTGACGP